jgi:hypothetical protein
MTTMDDLTKDEILPDANPEAIAAIDAARKETLEQARNAGFNPAIHASKPDGTPVLTKDGKFAKPRGRKAGQFNSAPKKSSLFNDQLQMPIQTVSSEAAAKTISGLLEQASVVLVSDEWKLTDEERKTNVEAWRQTLDYYGGVKLSPPQALVLNHLTIIATRSFAPKTQTKYQLFKAYLNDKLANLKFWKNKNAHTDRGENDVGKDNVRQEKITSPEKAGDQVNNA